MDKSLKFEEDFIINASIESVWNALTNPSIIKKYLFGTNTKSDFKEGSQIKFEGEYEGKNYSDKGIIIKNEKSKILEYSYYSVFSGLKDAPENYSVIKFTLKLGERNTILTLCQTGFKDKESMEHSRKNWRLVIDKLRKIVENN